MILQRTWLRIWLIVTAGAVLYLAWDAWPWLHGSPLASFRGTNLYQWPIGCVWWLLAPALVWLQRRLTFNGRRWPWSLALHLGFALAAIGIFVVLDGLRIVVANHLPASFLAVTVHDLLRHSGGWSLTPALVYLLLISGLSTFAYYREWRESQRLAAELQVTNARLETQLVRASLDALKMQLHPHFLFNTLNSITSLIRTQRTREAEEAVAGLGELLRRSLQHRQEAVDTLEHELDFLRRYLEIERLRFQDRLEVRFEVADDCRAALVPSLILQPLVENAMKHGIGQKESARLIRIGALRETDRLILGVYNDGPPLNEEAAAGRGIGLENILKRLRMLYGDGARLLLRDCPPDGVKAEIILPFTTSPDS